MVRGLGFERHVSGRVCVTVCVSMCDTLPRVNTVYNSAKHDLSFLYSIIACVPNPLRDPSKFWELLDFSVFAERGEHQELTHDKVPQLASSVECPAGV